MQKFAAAVTVLSVAGAAVVAAVDKGTWIEKDNLIIIEAEHGFPNDAVLGDSMAGNCKKQGCWKFENTHSGYDGSQFRGDGYIQWYAHLQTHEVTLSHISTGFRIYQ